MDKKQALTALVRLVLAAVGGGQIATDDLHGLYTGGAALVVAYGWSLIEKLVTGRRR